LSNAFDRCRSSSRFAHGERQHGFLEQRVSERASIDEIDGAGRRKIALIGVIRALLVLDSIEQLGDHEVDVGVALAVAMRVHVHGNAIDAGGQVGAVIQVEAAQEILVGLAIARVLSDHESGNGFEQLAGAHHGTRLELRARDRALSRRLDATDEAASLCRDHDLVEVIGGQAGGKRGGCGNCQSGNSDA
jgi:hypothetical protein